MLHFRCATTIRRVPPRSILFIVVRICRQPVGSDRYGKHETERRGVSGSKRKPVNEISAEQKTEKAGGKSVERLGEEGDQGRRSYFPTRSTLIDQSKRMKYWQRPIANYLLHARNEQFTREN